MSDRSTQRYDVAFTTEGIDSSVLHVVRVRLAEAMSTSFTAEIDLVCEEGDVNAAALAGKGAEVVFARADDHTPVRRVAGVVARVREHAKRMKGRQRIGITLASPLHALGLYTDFRIFQDKTTKDIVSECLASCGVPAAMADWKLAGSYPKREVCTQFGETTFQFVSRILEEDGIFYFFSFGDDGVKVVFGDGDTAYAKVAPSDTVRYREETALTAEEAIVELVETKRLRPSKVTLRDHDFKKPDLDLEVRSEAKAPFGREHYAYPGRYVVPAEGTRRAKLRLDAMVAATSGVVGKSHVFGLAPGHTFTLDEAPLADFNKEWLVVEVEHAWDESEEATSYSNRFRLIPKSLAYRPPARAPRAIVPGPQTAVVSGPAGEEIHCDEYGRVKVQFPWDRYGTCDDKSSCWVRVSQMHSSGAVIIPRIGWEVLVDFEDGDPDKPIVVGRLYNAQYMPPYPLPGKKTVSAFQSYSSPGGGGHNEVRMDDGAGAEEIHVHAQKDLNLTVANNKEEKVTTTQTIGVAVDQTMSVGANQTMSVGANQQLTVGGSQKWSVGAARMKTVSGDEKVDVGGDRSLSIGGAHMILTPKSDSTSTSGDFSELVGGACMEIAGLGVSVAVAGSCALTVGGAKIEAVAAGKSDITIGAKATTIGGVLMDTGGKDVAFDVKGAKATNVGGAWLATAASEAELSAKSSLKINVGGAVAMNASKIVLKVGGSSVTIESGKVTLVSSEVKLTASGPNAELAPMVGSK